MKHLLIVIFCFFQYFSIAQISDFSHIDFTKANNIVKLNEGKDLNNLPLLTFQLTHKLSTDVEKFRAIYLWVSHNIEGDAQQHNLVNRKRKKFKTDSLGYISWNNKFKKTAFKKLLQHKKTMCTGYAYLIKEMCFIANIECKIIDGYARSSETNINVLELVNHSWNAVKLNGKWYLCDATWASGYMINGVHFVKEYNDGYFLTDPILFAKNHYPLYKKWFLNNQLATQKFFPEPIVYNETFKHKIIPIEPNNLNTSAFKNQEVVFRFKALDTISKKDISLVKIVGEKHKAFKIYDLKFENGEISFKNKFKNRGLYDIHLKIKNDIVASYSFKINKSQLHK
jgi:transglutaminase/protease-like cytokinesis protein 3